MDKLVVNFFCFKSVKLSGTDTQMETVTIKFPCSVKLSSRLTEQAFGWDVEPLEVLLLGAESRKSHTTYILAVHWDDGWLCLGKNREVLGKDFVSIKNDSADRTEEVMDALRPYFNKYIHGS